MSISGDEIMANECSFSALITGRTANVREFLKTMRRNWAYEVICEDEPELYVYYEETDQNIAIIR